MEKNNSISIGSMQNSQVQQDAQNSNQTIEQSTFETDLSSFLESFIRDIDKLEDKSVAKELLADAETIKVQFNSPSPKKGIIKECLLSIKKVIEGAAGNVLGSYVPAITSLITNFSQ
ncbi:hypothetical protein [Pseudomonas sp. MAG002Y]|uniref:hypothetical protein n=1 Tax=Pseudomonas sp. MAG002Y TaxID=2678690 RepID=UPI001C60E58A|nr:hypothetical protein [Pseudomonas sp. MAG002Y]MBW5416308.1 hypothetical protein [Pseudomonas sp. MAG002Y]